MFWPCETRTSTCRSFATISSGLYRFLAIAVLLDVKGIPQVGPLQWGWIRPTTHTTRPQPIARLACRNQVRSLALSGRAGKGEYDNALFIHARGSRVASPEPSRPITVSSEEKRRQGGLAETIRTVATALAVALVIRTLLFQAFSIPSGSMEATLLVGDYLFVSTYAYGYTHYALPFSPPVFSGRVFGSQPKRGDVAVFRLPWDDSIDYIKRVIGLPGDRIEMIDGLLHINGVAVKRER